MAYSFGRKSLVRAHGVNDYLLRTAVVALTFSNQDMSIPWRGGKRTAEEQKELFLDKASRCDGYIKESYHQSGDALDLVPYKKGQTVKQTYTNFKGFQAFAKVMLATFCFLQALGQIPDDLYLHWGGFWSARDENNDGYLRHQDDKFGWDSPHWELRTRPQKNVLKIK